MMLLQVDQHSQSNCHERSLLHVHRVLNHVAASKKTDSCAILGMPITSKGVSAAGHK
jgi:hypothetical protein